MKDSDIIKGIRRVDGEEFKEALIVELKHLARTTDVAGATWWNAFRSGLAGALRRSEIEIPS